jgi:hypothetical protein
MHADDVEIRQRGIIEQLRQLARAFAFDRPAAAASLRALAMWPD